ncbi:hypothetical protein [Pseudomonas fluorescens]|uniref:hypothetical protein n=1 Tax=Pseudomonas fluorescens TaxID=294 RepID=UPI001CD4DAFF|nr:hypothetical protein [Pseudomonas fluorescens]
MVFNDDAFILHKRGALESIASKLAPTEALKIVPTLGVGMHPVTLRVTASTADAERPWRRSHAERGNDHKKQKKARPKGRALYK